MPNVSELVSNPGLVKLRVISAATTNLTSKTAVPTKLVNGVIHNTSAAAKYVKLYDKASAPAPASDVPIMTLYLPAASSLPLAQVLGDDGLFFQLGFAYSIVLNQIDTDATAVALGDVVMNLGYII